MRSPAISLHIDVALWQVIEKITSGVISHGFKALGHVESPITGTDGNVEFVAYFKRIGFSSIDFEGLGEG